MFAERTFSIIVIFLGMSATVFTLGACEKTQDEVSGISSEEILVSFETAETGNDPLLFMEQLTGNRNIIEIHGEFDVTSVIELLNIVNSGKADGSNRRYFIFSPNIRPAPVTMTQRRLDAEIAQSRAAREINSEGSVVFDFDIEYTIRNRSGERVYSLQNHASVELTPEIRLVGRRPEKIITYVVDQGEDNYGYGIYYIFSAIPWENRDSDFHRIMAALNNNDHNVVNAILLEKLALKNSEQSED